MQSDFALVIDKRPVKNFWRGRGGFLPIAIVERMMQGSIEDAEQYFNGRSPEGVFAVSAHYGIARDGRVWQFVEEEDTAWSNGVLQNPDLSIGWLKEVYQEKVNCNLVTLSIDYEGYSGEPLTPRQYEAALALHRQLIQRWEIEADNQHVIGHNWIDSLERSHNPGPLFPFNQLIKDLHTGPVEAAQPAQPNPLAFLETPLAGTETEVSSPPAVEPEPPAAYQPETVEEPAYRPQVEAFTFTPGLNDEVDQVTETPTEVNSASAEPEPNQTETFQDTSAYQPEEVQAEAAYQPETFQADIDDIEADLAYQPKEAPAETRRRPAPEAYQPEAAQAAAVQPGEVQTEEAQPADQPAVPPEEAQVEEAQVEEAQVEAVEPESVQAEPAFQPESQPQDQPEIFDAPGQPASLAQVETATFEAAEPAATEQTEPETAAVESAAEPTQDNGQPEAAEQAEETAPETTFQETAEPSEVEQVASETTLADQNEPETVAQEPAGHLQDDWASDIFADEFTPASENETAPPDQEPAARNETPSTGQLEVSPAIGYDITPKYSRPEFFDASYPAEPSQAEPTGMAEVTEAPASQAVEAAPAESELLAPVEDEAATVAEPESQAEAAPVAPAPLTEEASAKQLATESVAEEAPAEETPATETLATESPTEEAILEAPAEEVSEPPVAEINLEAAQEAVTPAEEANSDGAVEQVAQPAQAEPEKPEETHHWYDRLKNLFGGHEDKDAQATPEQIPAQPAPSPQIVQAAPFSEVENTAPEAVVEAAPAQAEPEAVAPETYQPDYTAEQEIFRSGPGTVEAATESALFDAGTTAEPEPARQDYTAEAARPEAVTESTSPVSKPELAETETPAGPAQDEAALQAESGFPQETPVNPPVETPQVEETFYPFELDTPSVSNHASYYRSGESDEQPGHSTNFDFGLNSPAPSYGQGYNNAGPSDYPFELPTQETPPSDFQSFAPPVQEPPLPGMAASVPGPASPAEDAQPAEPPASEPAQSVEPVIPPFSFEPEKAGEEPGNLFDTNSAISGHPKFAYDDLELPAWLNEPEPYQADQASNQSGGFSGAGTPSQEPAPPTTNDFAWATQSGTQENILPGWLQDSNEENGFPDWLKDSNETGSTQASPPAAPEAVQPSQADQSPVFKDTPAVEIPNKDWQENENLFEDDDFFSLLNQSGLDLSLERGGTGTLPSTGALPADAAPASSPLPVETPTGQAGAAAPAQSAPAPATPESEFDNFFDEVEPATPPAKMTVRQLIDRNDGYTAPLSYEDLDMSVPFGLEEEPTMPGNFQPLSAAPVASRQPAPTRADPPGFHRVDLGGGQTSVELANIRSTPSYDKDTIVRVSEQGERFEFDGWIEGPELRGSTRWYHIARSSGEQWIHSTLVQLDRPFRS